MSKNTEKSGPEQENQKIEEPKTRELVPAEKKQKTKDPQFQSRFLASVVFLLFFFFPRLLSFICEPMFLYFYIINFLD